MKRRSIAKSTTKSARSPYARYGKTPYQYPPWAHADRAGGYTPHKVAIELRALCGASGTNYWRNYDWNKGLLNDQ